MKEQSKTVYEGGEDEIVEKKSRFIAETCHVDSQEEAAAFIEKIRKKHWNAKHHCSAFVIGQDNEITHCSDDGEPSGTAGKPILNVLLGEELHNTAVVVTRYFGGTLLGTGGLVRAYSSAAQAGLKASVIITREYGTQMSIYTDYTGIGKIQYLLAQENVVVIDTVYTENVEVKVVVPISKTEHLKKQITEVTNGKSTVKELGNLYFALLDKKVKLFE